MRFVTATGGNPRLTFNPRVTRTINNNSSRGTSTLLYVLCTDVISCVWFEICILLYLRALCPNNPNTYRQPAIQWQVVLFRRVHHTLTYAEHHACLTRGRHSSANAHTIKTIYKQQHSTHDSIKHTTRTAAMRHANRAHIQKQNTQTQNIHRWRLYWYPYTSVSPTVSHVRSERVVWPHCQTTSLVTS